MKVKVVKSLSCVRLFATPWAVAHQAPPSMGFSSQEYWTGLPFPSPGDLPNPGIEPRSPALQADALTSEPPGIVFHSYPFHIYKVCSSSFSFQILLICTTSFFFVGPDRSSWTVLIFFRNCSLLPWFLLLFYWFQFHWILLFSLLFRLLALVLACSFLSFLRWELGLLIWDFLSFLKHAVSVIIPPSAMLWLCASHKFSYVLFSFSSVYFSNLP